MRNFAFLLFIGAVLMLSSCRKDFEFEASNGGLQFSRDTVYLDTVFKNIGSSTYTLKVYNRSDKDIVIPSIKLAKADSKYRMMVDGATGNDGNGKFFPNVELLAKDSLFIFIETTADITDTNQTDFLYTDQIEFDAGTKLQKVELVTLIQDAIFLYPQRNEAGEYEFLQVGDEKVYGFFLDENDPIHGNEYHMTNEKPYVIYGNAAVASGKNLIIDPGARLHFHDFYSGLIVANGGTITAGAENQNPTPETEVIFEGDRLEPLFSDIPGQWGAIRLTPGSNINLNHVTIKNAIYGIWLQGADATIKNTQIYDCSNYGIWSQTGRINAENLVINSAGVAALGCRWGGTYDFTHCTFNNNWPSSSQVAVVIDNYALDENRVQIPFDLQHANFTNCIIFGSNQTALAILKSTQPALWTDPVFTKCQIKFNAPSQFFIDNPIYNFINDESQIIKNGNPDFLDYRTNKLMIGEASSAKNFGIPTTVTNDILGTLRTADPQGKYDLGAYQSIIFETDN